MYSKSKTKTKKVRGIVKVEANSNGSLRLALPSALSQAVYGIKQKYIALGMQDTPENRKLAEGKAADIQGDINFERFDPTLQRYNLGSEKYKNLVPFPVSPHNPITLIELWQRYVDYKTPTVKPKTLEEFQNIARTIGKIETCDPLEFRSKLLEITTNHVAKRVLMQLSAAHKWAVSRRVVEYNPFDGMYRELPKYNYQQNGKPSPFTAEEKQLIIEAFANHNRGKKGISYSYYLPFVRFLFLTGCRPSEAIGLQWKHVSPDFRKIKFESSIVQVTGGKTVRSQGSKNNKNRTLNCNSELAELLELIKPSEAEPDTLVFPSRDGKEMRYNDFCRRAWNVVVDPIKPDTTPYCCRDTFISEQIAKGVPTAVVAKWADNSVQIIEKHYLGDSALEQLTPL